MKRYARLSRYDQVVEVFLEGDYDIKSTYPNEKIVECDELAKPLMWYVEGKWIQENEYSVPTIQGNQPLNGDQVIDILKFNGYEVWPL